MVQLSVGQKADTVATFRFMAVFLMEALARWTPQTPELEVKVLFGRHLWEFAQHADVLGHRTGELRAGLHYTRPPVTGYRQVLEECSSFDTTSDRVGGIYDVLVPDLARRYTECLGSSDPLLDQPSIRAMERILQDFERLQVERGEMLAAAAVPPVAVEWAGPLLARLAAYKDFVDFRPVSTSGSVSPKQGAL